MPATAPVPVPVLGEANVPLASFIRPAHRHYFTSRPERPTYRMRRYDFAGTPAVMPLVRAFLDTCAAAIQARHRHLIVYVGEATQSFWAITPTGLVEARDVGALLLALWPHTDPPATRRWARAIGHARVPALA